MIKESKGPTTHCAHGMFGRKKSKDGSTKVGFVADFKGINKILKCPGYPNESSADLLKWIPSVLKFSA